MVAKDVKYVFLLFDIFLDGLSIETILLCCFWSDHRIKKYSTIAIDAAIVMIMIMIMMIVYKKKIRQ